MTTAVAAMWGSSFLWIAIAIDHVETGVVPLGRCVFGAMVLAMFPAARRRIERQDWARFVALRLGIHATTLRDGPRWFEALSAT